MGRRKSVYGPGRNGFGRRNNNVAGVFENGNDSEAETIIAPTENIVNTTTNRRTIRRVFPTHIDNVNREVIRVENYYPVTESFENETIVEQYNCGNDIEHPCCKKFKHCRF